MVLCLVTLTDLQTRRAGLSASAELVVYGYYVHVNVFIFSYFSLFLFWVVR